MLDSTIPSFEEFEQMDKQEQASLIAMLLAEGYLQTEIARVMGIEYSQFVRICTRLGLRPRNEATEKPKQHEVQAEVQANVVEKQAINESEKISTTVQSTDPIVKEQPLKTFIEKMSLNMLYDGSAEFIPSLEKILLLLNDSEKYDIQLTITKKEDQS